MAKKPVVVHIAGQRFVVRSDADPTYVRTLAADLDRRIEELRGSGQRVVDTQKLAILAALNIADELFEQRRASAELKRRIRERSRAVLAFLDKEERAQLLDNN